MNVAGKGVKSCLHSKQFKDNYENIDWSKDEVRYDDLSFMGISKERIEDFKKTPRGIESNVQIVPKGFYEYFLKSSPYGDLTSEEINKK